MFGYVRDGKVKLSVRYLQCYDIISYHSVPFVSVMAIESMFHCDKRCQCD